MAAGTLLWFTIHGLLVDACSDGTKISQAWDQSHSPVDHDWVELPQPVSSCLRLQVVVLRTHKHTHTSSKEMAYQSSRSIHGRRNAPPCCMPL